MKNSALGPNSAGEAAGPETERFAASSGRWLGYVSATAGALMTIAALVTDVAGNRGQALAGVAIALVSWVVIIRPQVAAHEHGVLLTNMLRDTFVPWTGIRRCRVVQTLQVDTEEQTFHGLGLGRSARSLMREQRGGRSGTPFGIGSGGLLSPTRVVTGQEANEPATGLDYVDYVESQLTDRAGKAGDGGDRPVVAWAVPPLAALAVAAACVVFIFV